MPRGEAGSSPKKRAAATDLHDKLSKDELIKRLKVSEDNVGKAELHGKCIQIDIRVKLYRNSIGFHKLVLVSGLKRHLCILKLIIIEATIHQ